MMRPQKNRNGISLVRITLPMTLLAASGIAQTTRLHKSQAPATAVYTDQGNTFGAGNQSFAGVLSLSIKTGTGTPAAVDCDSAAKVGRVYMRVDAGSPNGSFFTCANFGAGATYGWELALAQGSGVTWKNSGALVGTRTSVNVLPGLGFNAITSDSGSQIDLTINADTAVLATVSNDVNFSGKKSFNVTSGKAGLRMVPSSAPNSSLAAGDHYFDSVTNSPQWYNGQSWLPAAFAAGTLTSGAPIIGNGGNQISSGAVTGTGNFVLASAPTISNPVITSFVNANHTHADATNGGQLALASAVTGVLPAANGGTGNNFTQFTGPTSLRTYTLPDADAAIAVQGSGSIASAASITPGSAAVSHITGTTSITSLGSCDAARAGRRLTLIFDGALTLTDGGNLKLAGNFVTTADDTMTLVCDGANWYETSRSVN